MLPPISRYATLLCPGGGERANLATGKRDCNAPLARLLLECLGKCQRRFWRSTKSNPTYPPLVWSSEMRPGTTPQSRCPNPALIGPMTASMRAQLVRRVPERPTSHSRHQRPQHTTHQISRSLTQPPRVCRVNTVHQRGGEYTGKLVAEPPREEHFNEFAFDFWSVVSCPKVALGAIPYLSMHGSLQGSQNDGCRQNDAVAACFRGTIFAAGGCVECSWFSVQWNCGGEGNSWSSDLVYRGRRISPYDEHDLV